MSLVVEAGGLEKRFSKFAALNGVSFQVERGAITGLIGPNGAGKTTTIKVILGLLRPDSGKVLVFGENPWDNPKIMEKVGVIQEKPTFPKNMSMGDYLERIARMHGFPETRAYELLRQEGLSQAANRAIGKLSAGMTQRFALAHALIYEPEFVVADEPTSNLDPQGRSDVLDSIARLNKDKGITFLISSHLLPELSRVCDTAVIISEGKIAASGNLQKLYETMKSVAARITTNKPSELADKIRSLDYVTRVEVSGENVLVETTPNSGSRLYSDVPQEAKEAGAELYGIESKSASLEELFRRTVSPLQQRREEENAEMHREKKRDNAKPQKTT